MPLPSLHLIGGPTASGKTALALEIARRENGTIINADAMQVYASLPLLTAQPSPEEKREVPHELFEIFDPSEKSSAGRWQALAEAAIGRAVAAGRTPIVVGGTGLYFRALLGGLTAMPAVPANVHEESAALYDKIGHDAFRARLAQRDPESATRIAPNDRQRLIRAYEIVAHTGRTLREWQKDSNAAAPQGPSPLAGEDRRGVGDAKTKSAVLAEKTPPLTPPARGGGQVYPARKPNPLKTAPLSSRFTIQRHLLLPDRAALYAACDARFLGMMKRGALEEVRALAGRNLDPALPAMKILGVRELIASLRDECSLDEAVEKAQQATRNYAKRQITWFRNQWPRDSH